MGNLTQPGIIITQLGVDVSTAADYQMIFNSNWPSLQIAFEYVTTVTAGTVAQIPHNLGFYPLTMAWYTSSGVSVGRFPSTANTMFDKTNVYIYNDLYNSVNISVSIKCYNIDISKSVDYALPKAPNFNRPHDKTFGIKVVKDGKKITSEDMRDFILHSRCQSPAILSIQTQDDGTVGGGTNSITYTNPANYVPWVLGFVSPFGDNTKYQCFPPGGNQAAPAFFQQGKTAVIWTNGTTGYGSLVVLRDPLVLPKRVQVIY